MAKPVQQKAVLKKRIQRFFNTHNSGRQQVNQVVQRLQSVGEVYLFGGAIRDIALQGIRDFYSDLDFVVAAEPKQLDALIAQFESEFKLKRNKFGGYRMQCDKWWLDVWALSNTWAFKEKLVELTNESSLLDTTILNWDAALYDMQQQKLQHKPDYFEHISQGYLELNLAANPNPKGALVRVLRTIAGKKVNSLGPKLIAYLRLALANTDTQQLNQYEQQHFDNRLLPLIDFTELKQALEQVDKQTQLFLPSHQFDLRLSV